MECWSNSRYGFFRRLNPGPPVLSLSRKFPNFKSTRQVCHIVLGHNKADVVKLDRSNRRESSLLRKTDGSCVEALPMIKEETTPCFGRVTAPVCAVCAVCDRQTPPAPSASLPLPSSIMLPEDKSAVRPASCQRKSRSLPGTS